MTWGLLVSDRRLARGRVNLPSESPVVIDINRIDGLGDFRSFSRNHRSRMRRSSRSRSRMRQRDRVPACDIRRAGQIGAAAVSPIAQIDDADIPNIAHLPVRAALAPLWHAAGVAARFACGAVASVRATTPAGLDAAADGVAFVAGGAGARGAATDTVRLGFAVVGAGTALC
jgi:hypothetical protein